MRADSGRICRIIANHLVIPPVVCLQAFCDLRKSFMASRIPAPQPAIGSACSYRAAHVQPLRGIYGTVSLLTIPAFFVYTANDSFRFIRREAHGKQDNRRDSIERSETSDLF